MIVRDYSIDEIVTIAKVKKILLWGAGRFYEQFEKQYRKKINADSILYVLDNSQDKKKTFVSWGEKKIQVMHPADVDFSDSRIGLIIITTAAAYEVYKQIANIKELKTAECCYCKFIESKDLEKIELRRNYPASFRRTQVPMIPKKIHYCWFGGAPIPEKYLEWMESWKRYCPNYEFIRWDENNYDFSWSDYMKEAYSKKKWAFVSDVARLDIIYSHGGIYLDTDVELLKPLDDLLYQKCYFGIESGGWVATGLGFGAAKGHPMVKRLIDIYKDRHFIDSKGKMDMTSCPVIQKPCFEEIGFPFDGELYYTEDVTIYPQWILCPKDLYTGKMHVLDYSVSVHHYDYSWGNSGLSCCAEVESLWKEIICKK